MADSASESNFSRNKQLIGSNSTASNKTIEEKMAQQMDKGDQIVLDEDKCIIDYVSERDMFILKNKKKQRIVFNLDNISDKGSNTNLIEVSNMSI
jgi:hypothetical protein